MDWLVLCGKRVLDILLDVEELVRGTDILMLCAKLLLRDRDALLIGIDMLAI